ncbi:hypothetical protein M408DRAFT_329244 [Serendipita vermifera MAFF 305830]|uniref:Uncharacterized protein n=1 Tax=Serendipita vermifera MAFF 305830 TaxID=933852 RepID=A0A0C2XI80_SERVB|nr:hypothetical protein M408DRAFT_329244 [Serendipita vermifera MAFF 305830]
MQFAYAGNEVNLSVWNTEVAFQLGDSQASQATASAGGKRARSNDQLFPGEIWRAKNVANDSLDLRQPVNISSLAFLSTNESGPHHNIAVGNTLGAVHRYDTRKGRKPASSWSDSRMSGGISLIEKGMREQYVAGLQILPGLTAYTVSYWCRIVGHSCGR